MAKPIRLGKAAGEFNVGISTIVDFLDSKGVTIDTNPNTKLEPEQYEMLRTEFAADQDLKEKSKLKVAPREKRETISLRDNKKDETTTTTTEEETPKEVVVEETPVQEEKDDNSPIKVVGKIDLDSLNTKTRPDKKPKEEPVEEKKEEVKQEEVKTPVVEEKKEEVIEEKKRRRRKKLSLLNLKLSVLKLRN